MPAPEPPSSVGRHRPSRSASRNASKMSWRVLAGGVDLPGPGLDLVLGQPAHALLAGRRVRARGRSPRTTRLPEGAREPSMSDGRPAPAPNRGPEVQGQSHGAIVWRTQIGSGRSGDRQPLGHGSIAQPSVICIERAQIRPDREGCGQMHRIEGTHASRWQLASPIQQRLVHPNEIQSAHHAAGLAEEAVIAGPAEGPRHFGSKQRRRGPGAPTLSCGPQRRPFRPGIAA